nr:LysR family transcriptional regulator [Azomonas macrocytogenes]
MDLYFECRENIVDLRQLRHFLALVEHRSFVRAADAVRITQPAFSRSIQGLEQELGCQLIDRGAKDLRPTPAGLVVLQYAQDLVRGASNLAHEVKRMGKLDAGELCFGCGPAPAARLVPETMALFVRQYPGIHVRFEVNNWERLARQLNKDEIEFFVADIRYFRTNPNFQTLPLEPRPGVYFCRPGHPLLERSRLTLGDLLDYPLASARIPLETRKTLANLKGVTDFKLNIECDHLPALEQIVCGSDTVGITTTEAIQPSLEARRMVRLPVDLPHAERPGAQCGIVTRTGYRVSAAARAMIDLLCEQDRRLHPATAA